MEDAKFLAWDQAPQPKSLSERSQPSGSLGTGKGGLPYPLFSPPLSRRLYFCFVFFLFYFVFSFFHHWGAWTQAFEISNKTVSRCNSIQLFRGRLSGKVHATILKSIVGGFEFSFFFQRNLKELVRKAMQMCLRVLKESNKSRFDSYSRQEPCTDHIPYYLSGLSRAHFFPTTFLEIAVSTEPLPRRSLITVVIFLAPAIS